MYILRHQHRAVEAWRERPERTAADRKKGSSGNRKLSQLLLLFFFFKTKNIALPIN